MKTISGKTLIKIVENKGMTSVISYLNDPEANVATFADGWFRTGDEGFKLRSKDGRDYYFLTGRIKA